MQSEMQELQKKCVHPSIHTPFFSIHSTDNGSVQLQISIDSYSFLLVLLNNFFLMSSPPRELRKPQNLEPLTVVRK
jgi:hypothetical protein